MHSEFDRFNFRGGQFDLTQEPERKFLIWIFNQFLYGEVTGIQCGYWLYRAPTLMAATFLAKQASEELSHVKRIRRIISLLGGKPEPAHRAIRFLASGMMNGNWGQHVAIEMALGEGLVLSVFYAMADTIPDPEIQKILHSAIADEIKHVEFGERETLHWLRLHPESRKLLLGMALIQIQVLEGLKKTVVRKILPKFDPSHPVLTQLEAFYDHLLTSFEKRVQALTLLDIPLRQLSFFQKTTLILMTPFRLVWEKTRSRTRLLTESYLEDPNL